MSQLPPMGKIFYDNGESIFVGHPTGRNIRAAEIEKYVKNVAKYSGQQLDWHYMGGRPLIWCIGDKLKAKEVAEDLCPNGLELEWIGDLPVPGKED